MSKTVNQRKVAMIGCDFVGSQRHSHCGERTIFRNDIDRCRQGPGRGRGDGYQSWTSVCKTDEDLCGRL